MKAAQELHVTQSAVSQNLLKLEEELQQPLFTRLHKKLVPTPRAHSLFSLIEPFVKNLARTMEQFRFSKSVPCGELRVGAPEEFGERYLIPVSVAFRELYSEVSFAFELGHPDKLLPMVENGELDFSFADIFSKEGQAFRSFKSLDITEVFQEQLILACSYEYFQNRLQSQTSFENLSAADFVCYQTKAPAIRNWFRHHFGKSANRINRVLTIESVRGVVRGIKMGMGLGIVPSHLISDELRTGALVHVKVKSDEILNSISLVRLQDKIESLTEKSFIAFFREKMDAFR